MQNEAVLRFCIWDFDDITHHELTEIIGITPSKVYIKGERRNPAFSASAKNNGWLIDSPVGKHASFEEQMNKLLEILEPRINLLKPLCNKYNCEFSCALFIHYNNGESMPRVHLGDRYNNLVSQLNVEFDIDLYCLPNYKIKKR